MTHRNLTCDELEAQLGDYLEGTLDDAAVAAFELHLSGCPGCTTLVRDFETIARAAAELPPLTPSRDLWPGIEGRIGTPVVTLAARAPALPSSRTWQRIRLGAIAAGLMGISALTTYSFLSRRESPQRVATADSVRAAPVAPVPGDLQPDETGAVTLAADTATPDDRFTPSIAPGEGAASSGTRVQSVRRAAPLSATLDGEIAQLRGVLSERGEQLDPRTIAIIESSISTIDSAIAEARAALTRDPASRFLTEQLNKSLEKKLGLLRTAALLPARS